MDRRIKGEFLPTCVRTREKVEEAKKEVKENEFVFTNFSNIYFERTSRIS